MHRVPRRFDPPPGPTAACRHNRLSRSFRQTQQTAAEVSSPQSQQPEFKTPTRVPRSRAGPGFSAESPHNDSDFQQDIIWDATSPSPNRLGKRGKKQRAGVVDISEIVNRIAPKHGRPKVAEPTLQQWIGDSAAIPCTPDVQVPKPKKKSPRPNGVDDLLKLAKQFDFNMFHQDEEEVEDVHQQSLELLSDDILDSDFSPSLPGNRQPAVNTAADTDPDQHMEDDLEFLFDGPTQHVSGDLSQVSSAQPSPREASGKPSSRGSTSGVSTTNTKGAAANDEFEDDWENDDLLNDSLVLEMTQNPQNFTAPSHCSTQKPAGETKHQRESPADVPVSGGVGQSAASKVEKDNVRQRTSFKLESNSDFSAKKIQTDTRTNLKVDYSSETALKDTHQSRFSSGTGASVSAGSQRTWQTSHTAAPGSQKPFHQKTSAGSSNPSNTAATKPLQSFPQRPAVLLTHCQPPAVSDLLDEDLDSFFSSDPVWDDPADDDLLCELCEDLENQIQSAENVKTTNQTLPVGQNQRAALQPASRTWDNRNQSANQQPVPQKQTPTALPCAPAAGFTSNSRNTVTGSFRFTQARNASEPMISSAWVQGSGRVQGSGPGSGPVQGNTRKDQFTFKKPNNPVSTAASKGKNSFTQRTNTAAFTYSN
ncbi:ewing's tumor-associated antigen 1 [Morone saxatilis]|uniref:ewing's tumor-associated antigen 1 n=1 Tax=Morone saxatilis TaxID=34816 RepID=UPI0015E1D779|nr:ewing's tumor-associated antigen 1 [Morone saxatilis]